jgi:hypothetical protein
VEELLDLFDGLLKDKGYLAMGGQIIDATISLEVSAPSLAALALALAALAATLASLRLSRINRNCHMNSAICPIVAKNKSNVKIANPPV